MAFDYVSTLTEPAADKFFWSLSDEEALKKNIEIQHQRRKYMYDGIVFLLRYNLDPNYVVDGVSFGHMITPGKDMSLS